NIDSVLEGEVYSVDYDATDNDQDTLTWTLNTNANWLGIDSSSGILSGTPDSNNVGLFSVRVSVLDGNSGSDFTNFTLQVLSDTDHDGTPNSDDPDDDNDGYFDDIDAFTEDPNEWLDTDSDGIGNNADTDDDNDGYLDDEDDLPLNDEEWLDTDFDGIGNNADPDDDNDGVPDIDDKYPLDPAKSEDTEEQEFLESNLFLILIVIIIVVVIILLALMSKGGKAGDTPAAPIPTESTVPIEMQTLKCPQCQNSFEAPASTTFIQCPHCGYSADMQ
ncbi:MAG: putative Ig domain-containing protein, partial [Thermoplasmata archaeon]